MANASRVYQRLATLLLASSVLAASFAATPAPAAAQETLPFTPPENWIRIPINFVHTVLSWGATNLSAFNVNEIGQVVPPAYFPSFIEAQARVMGSAGTSSDAKICGGPAYRSSVTSSTAPEAFVIQIQAVGGRTYSSIYARPAASAPDKDILAFMDRFCGAKSLAAAVLPPQWHATESHVLGTWTTGTSPETIILVSSKAASDAELAAKDAALRAFEGSSTEIVAKTTTTLCGLPATIITARVAPQSGPKTDVTFEVTQTATTAYTLLYTHPTYIVSDDAATASLATLCAAAPASPSPAPLPATSPMPSASP